MHALEKMQLPEWNRHSLMRKVRISIHVETQVTPNALAILFLSTERITANQSAKNCYLKNPLLGDITLELCDDSLPSFSI